jgi:type III pantothenate kinase
MCANSFIAVDIGNARIKLGLFLGAQRDNAVGQVARLSGSRLATCPTSDVHDPRLNSGGCTTAIPEPIRVLPLLGDAPELDEITPWLADKAPSDLAWWIASVNRPAATRLIDWLGERRPKDRIMLLAAGDLPLSVRLERPDMVGIDRLVDAVAVNRLRDANRSAVIVDVGTAITVDLVSADGAFLGGAILPGIQMSARAMHEFTDLLPSVDMSELTAPPSALGTATVSAMESGLFWGAVGAIRQLTDELCKATGSDQGDSPIFVDHRRPPLRGGARTVPAKTGAVPRPQVFLTGGAGASVADLLGPDARYVTNLTLAGIALSATVE